MASRRVSNAWPLWSPDVYSTCLPACYSDAVNLAGFKTIY